tara:strand:- start:6 stop:188 length:183 start_codon:yes stop_codon:yes gene_type:complete
MSVPYWQVGLKIGAESGQLNVHSDALEQSCYNNAIDHAIEMARAMHPTERIEFLYVKEYN